MRTILYNVIILFICIVVFNDLMYAQKLHYGVKGGTNIAALRGPYGANDSGSPFVGPTLGAFINYELNKHFNIQTEILYSKVGVNYNRFVQSDTLYLLETDFGSFEIPATYAATVEGGYVLSYIDIPFHLIWKISNRWGVSIGAHIGFLLNGENKGMAIVDIGKTAGRRFDFETEEQYINSLFVYAQEEIFDQSNSINNLDVGIIGGGHWRANDRMTFSFSANYGITSVQRKIDLIPNDYYNIHLRTTIAYKLTGIGTKKNRQTEVLN